MNTSWPIVVLAITAALCIFVLTIAFVAVVVWWIRSQQPTQPGAPYSPQGDAQGRPFSEWGDEQKKAAITEFLDFAEGMDQIAIEEWMRQKIEEEGWEREDVREYLDSREPIELN